MRFSLDTGGLGLFWKAVVYFLLGAMLLGFLLGLAVIAPILFAIAAYRAAKHYGQKAWTFAYIRRTLILHRVLVPVLFLLLPVIALIHAGRAVYVALPDELRGLRDAWRGEFA